LNNTQAKRKIEKLKPGHSERFSRDETGLARTVCVVRDDDGEYYCFLEAKSKLADGTKNRLSRKENSGSSKIGKRAYRLDNENGPSLYISQVIKFSSTLDVMMDEMIKLKNELNFPKKELPPLPIFQRSIAGPLYKHPHTGVTQRVIYAPWKTPLDQLETFLTEIELCRLAIQMLQAIGHLQKGGHLHNDFKLPNILAYRDADNELQFSLTDWGSVGEKIALATTGNESPEIALAHLSNKKSKFHNFFKEHYKIFGTTAAQQYAEALINKMGIENAYKRAVELSYEKPDDANEIYGLGAAIFNIYMKNIPR